jgi:hypothetical protein
MNFFCTSCQQPMVSSYNPENSTADVECLNDKCEGLCEMTIDVANATLIRYIFSCRSEKCPTDSNAYVFGSQALNLTFLSYGIDTAINTAFIPLPLQDYQTKAQQLSNKLSKLVIFT